MNTMTLDNYLDYSVVIESNTEPNEGFELLKEGKNGNVLSFLRFKTCLQTFGNRNRNKRLWFGKWMKMMIDAPEVQELINNGGIPGEAGHPVPPSGQVTMERILTIDPNNISHVVKSIEWIGEDQMNGIIETIDDGNGPGNRFMRNIMQGLPTSFSTRSVIPQRRNPDGTIDQTGPGRYVTSDRVFVPSHKKAYIDMNIPVKNICKKSDFVTAMESFVSYTVNHSDKIGRITDGMHPAMEMAGIDRYGCIIIPTDEGIAGIYPELKYRKEFADFMRSL